MEESRAGATRQSRSGLVVRQDKLFPTDGVTAWCSRKKCCRVSFLVAALIQGVLVIGLQVAIVIAGLGQFEDSQFEVAITEDCECEAEILDVLDEFGLEGAVGFYENRSTLLCGLFNISNTTMAEPSLGKDKLIYAIFFIAFVLFNYASLSLALYTKSIIDVYFSLLLNILMVIYGAIQVYSFRGFTGVDLELVGYIALANMLVLLLFTVVFIAFTVEMLTEFGWWIFTWFKSPATGQEGSSSLSLPIEGEGPVEEGKKGKKAPTSHLRFYYRYYRITVGVSWLTALFHVTFFIGELALFLPVKCDGEAIATILLIFAVPAFLILGYIAVRNEYRLLTLFIALFLCLSFAFFLFKTVRFATGNCPRCRLRLFINGQLIEQGDRNQQLEHLLLFSVLNLICLIVLLFMLAIVTLNYNKGLGDHFQQRWRNKEGWRKYLDLSLTIPAAIKWLLCRSCHTRRKADLNTNT